ncbi:MAG: PDZ domain-containing protein [Phormidesmis sp.]
MKPNILIGIGFAFLSILLGFLSYKKVLGDGWLDRADKVASIVSLLIAIISVAGIFAGQNDTSDAASIKIGGDNTNSPITQGDNNQVTIGDTTATAEQRSINALERVKSELLSNFTDLAVQVDTIKSQPPEAFWDARRVNETELAYQDRAKTEFRDYERFIQRLNNQTKVSGNLTATFQTDLAFNPDVGKWAAQTYKQQEEVLDSFLSFESSLQHLLSLDITDGERTAQAESLHLEKIANAKMALANAASYFCLIANAEDIELMRDTFARVGIDAQFQPGEDGYKAAKRLAAKFVREKADILKARTEGQSVASKREIDRRIEDPYLLMLRKATGLPETLTTAEVEGLRSRQINQDEVDPAELFSMAALSYLESDGKASVIYFERALSTGKLSEKQERYARVSLNRLTQSKQYGGSLGVMIVDLSTGGSFEKAGLQSGDVIISVGKEIVNEPMDIASAILKPDILPITIVRDGQQQILNLQGGQPASARLTPLITLNMVQL